MKVKIVIEYGDYSHVNIQHLEKISKMMSDKFELDITKINLESQIMYESDDGQVWHMFIEIYCNLDPERFRRRITLQNKIEDLFERKIYPYDVVENIGIYSIEG